MNIFSLVDLAIANDLWTVTDLVEGVANGLSGTRLVTDRHGLLMYEVFIADKERECVAWAHTQESEEAWIYQMQRARVEAFLEFDCDQSRAVSGIAQDLIEYFNQTFRPSSEDVRDSVRRSVVGHIQYCCSEPEALREVKGLALAIGYAQFLGIEVSVGPLPSYGMSLQSAEKRAIAYQKVNGKKSPLVKIFDFVPAEGQSNEDAEVRAAWTVILATILHADPEDECLADYVDQIVEFNS